MISWACFLLMSVMLASHVAHEYRNSRSLLDPSIFFAVSLFALYPLRLLLLTVYQYDAYPSYATILEGDSLDEAALVATLGIFGYVIAYTVFSPGLQLRQAFSINAIDAQEVGRISKISFLISLMATGYKIATGDYISYLIGENRNTAFVQVVNVAISFQWVAYVGVIYLTARRKLDALGTGWVIGILGVIVPYQFIQGSKTFLSLLAVNALLAVYLARRKLPGFGAVAGLLFIVNFVFPYVLDFREYVNSEYESIPSISELNIERFAEYRRERAFESQDDVPSQNFLQAQSRFAGIDEIHQMILFVPNVLERRWFSEFGSVFITLIPRFVWPSKPEFSRGARYGAALGTITSVTPFPIGEAIWDGGEMWALPGMAIWAGLLALYIKGFCKLFSNAKWKTCALLLFVTDIYWIAGSEATIVNIYASAIQKMVFLWLIVSLNEYFKTSNSARPVTSG